MQQSISFDDSFFGPQHCFGSESSCLSEKGTISMELHQGLSELLITVCNQDACVVTFNCTSNHETQEAIPH